jgi:hypothetical protein
MSPTQCIDRGNFARTQFLVNLLIDIPLAVFQPNPRHCPPSFNRDDEQTHSTTTCLTASHQFPHHANLHVVYRSQPLLFESTIVLHTNSISALQVSVGSLSSTDDSLRLTVGRLPKNQPRVSFSSGHSINSSVFVVPVIRLRVRVGVVLFLLFCPLSRSHLMLARRHARCVPFVFSCLTWMEK